MSAVVVNLKFFAANRAVIESCGLNVADSSLALQLTNDFVAEYGSIEPPSAGDLSQLTEDMTRYATWAAQWLRRVAYGVDERPGVGIWKAAVFCISVQAWALDEAYGIGVCDDTEIVVVREVITSLAHGFDAWKRAGAQ